MPFLATEWIKVSYYAYKFTVKDSFPVGDKLTV
jgi:hypothetical protein